MRDKTVAVSVVSLNTREEKALNIALNKHSGEWDAEALGVLLKDLQVSGFDMDAVGFDAKELKAFEAPELDPQRFWDHANHQGLCTLHHNAKSHRERLSPQG